MWLTSWKPARMKKPDRNIVTSMTATSLFWTPPNAILIPRVWRSYQATRHCRRRWSSLSRRKMLFTMSTKPPKTKQSDVIPFAIISNRLLAERSNTRRNRSVNSFPSIPFLSGEWTFCPLTTNKSKKGFLYEQKQESNRHDTWRTERVAGILVRTAGWCTLSAFLRSRPVFQNGAYAPWTDTEPFV